MIELPFVHFSINLNEPVIALEQISIKFLILLKTLADLEFNHSATMFMPSRVLRL